MFAQKGKGQEIHVIVWIWRLSLNPFLIDRNPLRLKHHCISGRWQTVAFCFTFHMLLRACQDMFCYPLSMILLCIYQCHCHIEVATLTFGSRNRQEPALLFAPAQPGDKDTAPGGVRGLGTCQRELATKFSRIGTGVEENRAKAPNSDCSQAHRIVLMSVLIKIFQGQFELWLPADRYVLFPFWDLQLPANHQTVFSQL